MIISTARRARPLPAIPGFRHSPGNHGTKAKPGKIAPIWGITGNAPPEQQHPPCLTSQRHPCPKSSPYPKFPWICGVSQVNKSIFPLYSSISGGFRNSGSREANPEQVKPGRFPLLPALPRAPHAWLLGSAVPHQPSRNPGASGNGKTALLKPG